MPEKVPSQESGAEIKKDGRWGLALSGGGLSSSYGLGVVQALRDKHGLPAPAVVVASSASTPTGCVYETGQIDEAVEIWLNRVSDSDIVDPSGVMPTVDIMRVIDVVRESLKTDRLFSGASQVHFVATDFEKGVPTMLNASRAGTADRLYRMMSASMALPGAYGDVVEIDGRPFVDGDLSSTDQQKVDFIRSLGIEDVIAVRSADSSTLKGLMKILRRSADSERMMGLVRDTYKNVLSRTPRNFPVIFPSRMLPTGLLRNPSAEAIRATIALGYEDGEHFQLAPEFAA
ncbi:MAG: patatin-like phospholipase family protein [Candidatus Peregrinibacteria bacterium]|nr:patatin-like phospholipase family protein [Candidatus Peregrinibacteria bacterium]